jgi:hypothetical protein
MVQLSDLLHELEVLAIADVAHPDRMVNAQHAQRGAVGVVAPALVGVADWITRCM